MSTLGDRLVMTVIILGMGVSLLAWVAGAYIGPLPPWYSGVLLPIVFAVFVLALGFGAWKWLKSMD